MHNVYRRTLLCAFSLTLFAIPASAQEERVRLSVGTAATTGGGDNLALTASVGYRFLERLSFEVDFTAADSPGGPFVQPLAAFGGRDGGGIRGGFVTRGGPGFPGGPGIRMQDPMDRMQGQFFERAAIFPPVPVRNEGDLALVTAGFRYELPVQGGRLRPYLGGGLGIARSSEQFGIARPLVRGGIEGMERGAESLTRTGVAASAGAGASLRMFKGLFADVDVRYFRLDRGRDLTRLGGGVSYRF